MHPLVSQLTLEEKVSLLSGATIWTTAAVNRLGISSIKVSDGPHGLRYQPATGDHLGINDSEPATAFPTGAATGSSWDVELLRDIGIALGRESRIFGVDVLLGPGVNIKRSPLCGRNFEYFSEDPVLSGELGTAWVTGVQSEGVGASVKHFAANNQETERMRVSAQVDERTLREIYLPAFEQIVKEAKPATVMCSYNAINGTPSSENSWLLSEVLRQEWGFDGLVVSDWGAVTRPAAAAASGTDLAMPASNTHRDNILAALSSGVMEEDAVDKAVSRILTVHDRVRQKSAAEIEVDFAAHHQLAMRAAVESSVLLTNEGQLLPLTADRGGQIAVIGEFARTPRYQGAGSSHVTPTRVDAALDAITGATSRDVTFAPGFRLDGAADQELLEEAVSTAAAAEAVILFLGLPEVEESEGFDRTQLELPEQQLRLAEKIFDVASNVVIVLSNGGVVDLSPFVNRADAILEMWLGGQASGTAAAQMIFGFAEPGGRLAETIPLQLRDTPAYINWPGTRKEVLYGERIYVGYRWYDMTHRQVAFPFGHGLGYTTFTIKDVDIKVADPTAPAAVVEATITNTGSRTGSEVVQVYVGDLESSLDRPIRELKGFTKVRLESGESTRVQIQLDSRAFAFWKEGRWTVEPGTFRIEVGTSSRRIMASSEILLDVPAPLPILEDDSTLGEWLDHPVGSLFVDEFFVKAFGAQSSVDDEGLFRMAAGMPFNLILSFGGREGSDEIVAELRRRAESINNGSTSP
jgi:beta-glucosidase